MSILTHNLGFPRIGPDRELKKALEAYWRDPKGRDALLAEGSRIRRRNWQTQREAGIGLVPCNDFSFYDHVLDHIRLLGCAPARYAKDGRRLAGLEEYFAMARGDGGVAPLEMTKWLDTNYHYLVPELAPDQEFALASTKPFDEFREARNLGLTAKPVFLGPLSFLRLSKPAGAPFDRLGLLPRLVPVYALILRELRALGAEWVQLDEPVLAMDMDERERLALAGAYEALAGAAPGLSLLVCSYFGGYGENLAAALALPVRALHLDLFRAGAELEPILAGLGRGKSLSLGIVDGRNVWRNDYAASLAAMSRAQEKLGADRLLVAPSCSLLHVPVSLAGEAPEPPETLPWLAFAEEKLREVSTLARLAKAGNGKESPEFRENQAILESRRNHPAVRRAEVRDRLARLGPGQESRRSPYPVRRALQEGKLPLPPFPTTTIGSFPQTDAVRRARALYKQGKLPEAEYLAFLREETLRALRIQEEIGLDVLAHGEFERNDMVEYFGEKLDGFAFTRNGWVQSYGSRCVKPPILYGDVRRKGPMTVDWAAFALKAARRPVKGMLTGPVTILKWSFVRDDQPGAESALQIALAIRDEVADLEDAGLGIIQIDEPALREALPLRKGEWDAALDWEVRAFRIAASGARDETQIHTHMCYCDFGEIMGHIVRMDADVISLEASRSRMELLDAFSGSGYPNGIGPGVWDIHSPRAPDAGEMRALLERACRVLEPGNLWVNPDCGLKTRRWEEALPALRNMVEAARELRRAAAAR